MNRYEKILEKAIMGADLVGEAIPGQPLVELTGDCRIFIENHYGISMYGRNEIHIRVRYGTLCVCGGCLELIRMSRQQLVIKGKIDTISIKRTVH